MMSILFTFVGIRLMSSRIVTEAQETVKRDLNSARELYSGDLRHVNDIVRLTADRYIIITALTSGNLGDAAVELRRIKEKEGLDMLDIADTSGTVIVRPDSWPPYVPFQTSNEVVMAVLRNRSAVAATSIVGADELALESPALANQAFLKFVETPMARARGDREQTAGMMLLSAAPILDYQNQLVGVVYGGTLLNKNYGLVDGVKQTVFQGLKYEGQDIGTATIFQDDVRISTNVRNQDGTRAIGTRIMKEVYDQVITNGKPWIGRAYVVNSWYITAYEPILDLDQRRIGILYVGILEKKYVDIQRDIVVAFLTIAILGGIATMGLAYVISRRISVPLSKLVSASREIADGNLDARVDIRSADELGKLAYAFNKMASVLRARDQKLEDFATKRIMESEKLAIVGQLAASVAHELNNPLTGIVTFSHLLLEKETCDGATRSSMEKIAGQADRCRDIIRGLLDFSRQRKPEKTPSSINSILRGCVSLVENQAPFQNIRIVEDYRDDLPLIVIDPSQIERVFMNLIINAAEAMEGGGKLVLTTRLASESKAVEVEVADTGHGISEENMGKLFEPFFSTKDVGHGTGLGLAISYGIVKSHKGMISVDSQLGRGTTFVVRLPLNGIEEAVENESEGKATNH
jgi:two-component system NtrC family sensor kinase